MKPNWLLNMPLDIINDSAKENNVPVNLLLAFIQTESGGNRYATRFEPAFTHLFHVREISSNLLITPITEEVHQKTSWGLGQIMGAVCREWGFQGHLPEMCDPKLNLGIMCKIIKKLAGKYSTQREIISAYNAGSLVYKMHDGKKGTMFKNEVYVDKVSMYLRQLEGE